MKKVYTPTESFIPHGPDDAGQRDFAQLCALGKKSRGSMPDEHKSSSPLISRGEQNPPKREHP